MVPAVKFKTLFNRYKTTWVTKSGKVCRGEGCGFGAALLSTVPCEVGLLTWWVTDTRAVQRIWAFCGEWLNNAVRNRIIYKNTSYTLRHISNLWVTTGVHLICISQLTFALKQSLSSYSHTRFFSGVMCCSNICVISSGHTRSLLLYPESISQCCHFSHCMFSRGMDNASSL